MCFWSKCLDISDVKRAFVANVLIYQMSDMIIHNMHGYFINRILKTELLFILCSGQKCLQFYLTFTSCLPLPPLTFCQIKNKEKKHVPRWSKIFSGFGTSTSCHQLPLSTFCQIVPRNSLEPRSCHLLVESESQIFEVFFVKFGLNQGQAGTKSGEL